MRTACLSCPAFSLLGTPWLELPESTKKKKWWKLQIRCLQSCLIRLISTGRPSPLLLFLTFPLSMSGMRRRHRDKHMCSSSVSVPACGSAHTCNRCVISASRPRRRCQHVRRRRRDCFNRESRTIRGRCSTEMMFHSGAERSNPTCGCRCRGMNDPVCKAEEFQDVCSNDRNAGSRVTFHLCMKIETDGKTHCECITAYQVQHITVKSKKLEQLQVYVHCYKNFCDVKQYFFSIIRLLMYNKVVKQVFSRHVENTHPPSYLQCALIYNVCVSAYECVRLYGSTWCVSRYVCLCCATAASQAEAIHPRWMLGQGLTRVWASTLTKQDEQPSLYSSAATRKDLNKLAKIRNSDGFVAITQDAIISVSVLDLINIKAKTLSSNYC